MASVELWSRYRATSTGTWGPWTLGPTGTSSPITYTFSSGNGFYEFYTIAIDAAGSREASPATADATTQKTAPTGTGKAWGSNSQGQLGNGTTANSSTAVDVANLTGITSLGAGAEHSLGVKSDGTAWPWGQNANGELGDGTTRDRTTPVQVSGFSGVSAVAGGTAHSLALKSAGTVWGFRAQPERPARRRHDDPAHDAGPGEWADWGDPDRRRQRSQPRPQNPRAPCGPGARTPTASSVTARR